MNMKEPQPAPERDEMVARILRQMPPLKAPEALGPRVRAALAARRSTVWWRREVWAWPPLARWAWLILAGGLGLGLVWLSMWGAGALEFTEAGDYFERGRALWQALGMLAKAGEALLRGVLQPWVVGAMVLVVAMYLFCLVVGTALFRLATRRL